MTMGNHGNFNHPFQPYDIQVQFMQALYDCIEQGKVGIFESPTGTGKSLSLACGSLTWLRDHKRKAFDDSIAAVEADNEGEPEWMIQHAREEKRHSILQRRADLESRLEAIRQRERKVRERQEGGLPSYKRRKLDSTLPDEDEERFVLDDYQSDDDIPANTNSKGAAADLGLSKETQALMQKLGYSLDAMPQADNSEPDDELKIFFCSRTHSQLTQFVGELRRIKLPPTIPQALETENAITVEKDLVEELKHLTLGSRKNLCINPKVAALRHPTAINERCLGLQDSKTPADKKCPFVPTKDNEASVLDFQHYALSKIRDIEDLGTVGKRLGVCPYYSARPTIKPSEIVTLPYPLLLQKSAREALGLSLKDHVIIIDEAHNLMDAILGIYTVEVSLAQLQRAREQLTVYLQKFRNKLKGKNRVYVTQVVRLLDSLITYLRTATAQSGQSASGNIQAVDLLQGKGVDQINLYKLMNYLRESKLARKVEGYVLHQSQTDEGASSKNTYAKQAHEITMPVLTHIQSFFFVLTNPAREGRFFFSSDSQGPRLKYLLLDPSEHFREIVEDARAVILAGGTMSPMDDYTHQLFPYLPASGITTLSCGHVIPASNLFVSPLMQTITGTDFDFTFKSRNSPETILSLGESFVHLLPLIPDGTVIFFPSYAYLDRVTEEWKKPLQSGKGSIWSCLDKAKPIFREIQSDASADSNSTEDVLAAYSKAIDTPNSRGALLLSVIGGKLSEGINFSDRLGRCVVVVGLPYPNPNLPEWKAKMEYIERKAAARGVASGIASREFAENLCMRAVNQAIGRAVRHKADWASILLVDKRYGQKRITNKLPRWIQTSLPKGNAAAIRFAGVESGLRRFYAEKSVQKNLK